MTEKELAEINEACDMATELNNFKSKIYEYVESRMAFIAPNITAIVGKLNLFNKLFHAKLLVVVLSSNHHMCLFWLTICKNK